MPCGGARPPVAHPSWTRPRSSRCGPHWSKAPRRMVSRPICGPWSGSARWSRSYDTTALIQVLEQVRVFYAEEPVVLVRDGLSAHRSRAMRARAVEQAWLTLE